MITCPLLGARSRIWPIASRVHTQAASTFSSNTSRMSAVVLSGGTDDGTAYKTAPPQKRELINSALNGNVSQSGLGSTKQSHTTPFESSPDTTPHAPIIKAACMRPALFTNTSQPPNVLLIQANAATTSDSLVTSHLRAYSAPAAASVLVALFAWLLGSTLETSARSAWFCWAGYNLRAKEYIGGVALNLSGKTKGLFSANNCCPCQMSRC